MAIQNFTVEQLKEILSYDPETGIFRWRKTTSRRLKVGQIAGSEGCRGLCINARLFGAPLLAHRLAWMYMTGSMPDKGMVIDHRDRNPFNNIFSNLRLCTQKQNTWNQGLKRGSRTGVKGVHILCTGRYQARLRTEDGIKSVGNFKTLDEATVAIREAREKYHGEYACHGGSLSPNRPD